MNVTSLFSTAWLVAGATHAIIAATATITFAHSDKPLFVRLHI